ncbi:AraC family transcriptional regulator [Micromonospora sp. U56]|uniref:helix-turn-helix domain-containing protein n=1 Tax=Micromonospora sp. U56 TaxID=2824900 RepID=UPI001B3738B4|nr:helix-turn-helix domain-containing protein [Micromonospora sp. U56]MBQ0894549.1 AraC family transcriptional regulator [Micromonospora sp. U56]
MGGIEACVGLPDPRLRPFVDRYLGYRESAPLPLVRREVAGAFVVLVLGWGAPLDVVDPRASGRGVYGVDSFVAGPFDRYCITSTLGVGLGVQLVLTPPAARRVLGLPLGELANRAVPVGDLPDRWLDRLRCRLADAPDWPRRFALLDAALGARLAGSAPLDPTLGRAWRRLAGTGGRIGVGDLADELGWSSRHLAVRFGAELGLTPKATARLLRFGRAYATLARELVPRPGADASVGPGGWAELATRCGYYDQSHLIRDFREFAGTTLATLARSGSLSSNPG